MWPFAAGLEAPNRCVRVRPRGGERSEPPRPVGRASLPSVARARRALCARHWDRVAVPMRIVPVKAESNLGPTPARARPSRSRTTGRSAARGSKRPVTAPPPALRRRLPCSRRAKPGSRTAASDVSVDCLHVHARPRRPARASFPPPPSAGASTARRRATPRDPGWTAKGQRHAACPVGWRQSLPASRVRARRCRARRERSKRTEGGTHAGRLAIPSHPAFLCGSVAGGGGAESGGPLDLSVVQ